MIAESVWKSPTHSQYLQVLDHVDRLLTQGHYKPTFDGEYQWGNETIKVEQ